MILNDSRSGDGPVCCWRCGGSQRCQRIAGRAGRDDPLHYTDTEVAEGWPGDDSPLPWLHRRAAEDKDEP